MIYLRLLERELERPDVNKVFNATEEDLLLRAKASGKSIEEGRTRSFESFKQDVEVWRKNRNNDSQKISL
jgi:hypothetical protein